MTAKEKDVSDRRLLCVAAEAVGACLLIVAAAALPWASYRVQGGPGTSLHADSLSAALIGVAAVAVVVSALQLAWRSRLLAWSAVAAGGLALVLSVVGAGRRIAEANTLAQAANGGATTAFAGGSALALVGAFAMTLAAAGVLVLDRSPVVKNAAPRPWDRATGIALIVLGALIFSVVLLAAFTPIGLLAAPFGGALIVIGALRLDRASGRTGQ